MKNFIQDGDYMEVTLAAAIVSGAGLLVVDTFGFATKSGGIGDKINIALEGVYEHAKAGVAITKGTKMYWDNTAKVLTSVAMGNKLIGVAFDDALIGDAKAKVRLMDAPAI